jgi:hypothetical protein
MLALIMFYKAALASGRCFVVVTVVHSPGGEIQFAGTTRSLPAGSRFLIAPVVVTDDSEFVLQCDGAIKREGYISRYLDLLVYVNIRNCEITSYRTFG